MKPHIRKVEQYWLCTEDRKERHVLRGSLGITPCQAFYNFIFQKNLRDTHAMFNKQNCRLNDTSDPASKISLRFANLGGLPIGN